MNLPMRHHFIPQFILRNFTNDDGYLYCYSKQARRMFKSTPSNVFLEKHLYSQRDERGKKNPSVETEISHSIDGPAAPVLDKIVKTVRNGTLPGLTGLEKRIWDEFFCCQLRRLPTARGSISDAELVAEALDDFERHIQPLSATLRDKYKDAGLQRDLAHNAWTKIIAQGGGELMDVLQRKGLAIGLIENQKKSFIIGDNPTIRITPHGNTHLSHPQVELLLPIAHDVIVTPGYSAGKEELASLVNSDWVRKINESIFRQSNVIAGRSQKLLESLSGVRAK